MAATVDALGTGDLATVGAIVTVVLVVLGVVLGLLITKLIARAVIAIVVIVLAILVWQQRSHVENRIKQHCSFGTTYFGIHVDPPQSVKDTCTQKG